MTTLSLTTVRSRLPQIVKSVNEEFERVTITVNGESKAVVLSPEELEAYEETIATLSNEEAIQALIQSEKDWNEGDIFSHEEIFGA